MSEKFQNNYRIGSNRLGNWDYSRGLYFVTIITKDRMPYFGRVINKEMHLTEIGKIAEAEWLRTPLVRPDMNIILKDFAVMPDHMHGIIGLQVRSRDDVKFDNCRDAMHGVSTIIDISTSCVSTENRFGPQFKNLPSVVRGFKSTVTTQARKLGMAFDWQERYHDRIIRNEAELHRISKYIKNNFRNF